MSEAKTALDLARECLDEVLRTLVPDPSRDHFRVVFAHAVAAPLLDAIPADAPERLARLRAELARVTRQRETCADMLDPALGRAYKAEAELAQVTGERDDLRQDNARLHREADGFRDRALEEHERAEKLERALEHYCPAACRAEHEDILCFGSMLDACDHIGARNALVKDRKGTG